MPFLTEPCLGVSLFNDTSAYSVFGGGSILREKSICGTPWWMQLVERISTSVTVSSPYHTRQQCGTEIHRGHVGGA